MKDRSLQIWMMISVMLIVSMACSFGFVERFDSTEQPRETAPTAEDIVPEELMYDETPSAEQLPTSKPTANPTNTSTPEQLLVIGSTMVNPVDGAVMVYVPEGEFLMGSEDDDASDREKPVHLVYLDAFYIYQHEVTNDKYRACVDSGECRDPGITKRYFHPDYGDHPIVGVTWFNADAYCQWAGGRLPTEAEWEKAARGTDGRKFPWGNENPTCSLLNFHGCVGGTSPVGSYPAGASPYGALDMAGNVREWVADWFDEDYYSRAPYENPIGPMSGTLRGVRGCNWSDSRWVVRVSVRWGGLPPDTYSNIRGFRCVRLP